MSRPDRLAWMVGDVDRIVEDIRRHYAETEGPFSSRLSVSTHARQRGYSWMNAHVLSPEKTASGRTNYRRTVQLIAAVATAVNRVIDEHLAESERRDRVFDEHLAEIEESGDRA